MQNKNKEEIKIIHPEEGEVFDIELEEDFLEKNRKIAFENRACLDEKDIVAVDIMGSVGSGKTSLISLLTSTLKDKYRIGIIAGDLTTDIDARRLKGKNIQVVQVNTGKECHLDANLIKKALREISLDRINLIFIENVGNLICPAEFPLGAQKKLVVISVTEGPWMVVKHPYIFEDADVVAVNKIDVAEAMQVFPERIIEDVRKINPAAKAIPVSCRKNLGIDEVAKALGL